jgi:hypothetical protein
VPDDGRSLFARAGRLDLIELTHVAEDGKILKREGSEREGSEQK